MKRTLAVSTRILALLAVLSFFSSGCSLIEDILSAITRRCADSIFTVTYTADTNTGSCMAGSCSLRQAVALANICPGVQTIEIPGARRYYLTTTGAGDDRNLSGDLDITDSVDIVGGHSPIIDGNRSDRIFDVHAGATVNLTGLTLTNGYVKDGGAIRNAGILHVHNTTLEENAAWDDATHEGGWGGGILSSGEILTVDGSTLTGNSAGRGGGIAVAPSDAVLSPSFTLDNSSLSGNSADMGAGLYLDAEGLYSANATLTRFSINGNETFPAPLYIGEGTGGGIWNAGSLALYQGDITGNHAVITGGGIYNIGNITADQVAIQNNRAPSGGAIYTERPLGTPRPDEFGVAHFARSAIVSNWNANPSIPSPLPGDVHNDGVMRNVGGDLSIENTTVGRNMGNGIGNYGGNLQIDYSTLTENDPYQLGGDAASRTTVSNSIVSDRFHVACLFDDLSTVTSNGFNIDSSDECNFHTATDRIATDPLLLPFTTDGLASFYPLAAGSPALDSADPARCSGTDQRGTARPQGPACDRGAYEVVTASTTAPLTYATPTPEATKSGIILIASPTPTFTPAGASFGSPSLSGDQFYSGGAGCGPLDLKLQIGVLNAEQVSSVVLFFHLEDKAGGGATPWNDGVAMESLGDGQYSYDLVSKTIPAFNSYPEAWLVYQFAATGPGGTVLLRSPAFKDVTLSMCGKK